MPTLKFRGGQLAHENNKYLPHENYPLYGIIVKTQGQSWRMHTHMYYSV